MCLGTPTLRRSVWLWSVPYKNLPSLSTTHFLLPMKQIAITFFFLLSCVLLGGELVAIRVDQSEDYAILDQFFKTTLLLEEYGYVLEGAKPVSFRNFCSLDGLGVTNDFENTAKEFEHSLL